MEQMKATEASVVLGVADDRQVPCRKLHQPFRPMGGVCVKEESISWLQGVNFITMPVVNLALQHIDRLDSAMLERWKDVRLFSQRNEVWLYDDARSVRS